MGRGRKARKGQRGPKGFQMDPLVRIGGRVVTGVANSSTVNALALNLNPGLIGRTQNMAKAFEFFRFSKLRFRVHPGNTTSNSIVAYNPDITSVAVTYSQLLEQPYFAFDSLTCTIPSPWCNVPRSTLWSTPTRWWKTNAATSVDSEIIQGQLLVATSGATAAVTTVEIEYMCEFKGAQGSGLQP